MHVAVRILLWILAVIVVTVAGLLLYLRNADLSVYEEPIEEALSDIVGHEVRIDGLFRLQFGSLTSVTAEQVSVTNRGWQQQPSLLSVGHLSVSVDLWSLLSGPVIIEELDVRNVEFRLQRNAESQANWDVERPANIDTDRGELDEERIAFREIRVEDFRFELTDPARRRPLNLIVAQLNVAPDANRILALSLDGMVNEFPLAADGQIGPWENLLTGRDLTANLSLTLGQVALSVNGSVTDLRALEGVDLTFDLDGPSIDRVADVLGLPPIARGAFQLDGRVLKTVEGSDVQVEGNFGDIAIFALGNVDRLIRPENANLQFRVSGPNTQYVAELFGFNDARPVPFRVTGEMKKTGARVEFTDTRAQLGENMLNLEGWLEIGNAIPDVDLSIEASGPDLSVIGPFVNMNGIPSEAFEVDARIQKTGADWRFDNTRVSVGENRIAANGVYQGRRSADSEITVTASGPDISFLQPMTGLRGLPARSYEISGRISPDSAGMRLSNAIGVFGDKRISVDGVIGTVQGLGGTSLSVHAEGPELKNVALLTRVPLLPDGPFDVDGDIRVEENLLSIDDATAKVAGMEASASGSIGLGPDKGDFDLLLSARGPDFAEMLNFQWLERMEGYPFDLNGRIVGREGWYELNAVNGSIGNLTASMDGELAMAENSFDLTLNATSPDSEMFGKLIDVGELPVGAFSAAGRIEKSDSGLVFTDVETRIGAFLLNADGTLSRAPLSNRSDLRFSLSGPDLRELGLPFQLEGIPALPFSVSAEVNGTPTGFAVENLDATVGDSNISGEYTADLRGKPEVTGVLESSYLDLTARIVSDDIEVADADEEDSEFLFSNEPLNAAWLKAVNIDVAFKADHLKIRHGDLQDIHIGLKLWDGALSIEPISFRESEGTLSGRLELEPVNGSYRLDAEVVAENVHLGALASKGQDRSTIPPLNGKVALEGAGRSIHEILAGANGEISLRHGAGRVRGLGSSRLFGDMILQIIRTLNPLKKKEAYTTVECALYDVNIENGVATIQNLAIQSDVLTILAFGNVNFGNEVLSLSVRATPREGIGISIGGVANSFLKLGGTLKKPQLQIDPTASVTTTGVAIATGGISLLARGLWDRMSASNDICKDSGVEETPQ